MRASWKGYFRIGDLTMPVRLYSATRSISPNFVQLDTKDHLPVKRVTVSAKDGKKLNEDDIVRAIEHEGRFIELSEQEIARHAGFERDIVVQQITDPQTIDPIYYDSPYYLVPDRGGELIYSIQRRAFEKTGLAAIITMLFYGRERLGVVTPVDGLLRLQTLRFDEEIISIGEIDKPALPRPSPTQVSVASELLERHNLPFHASDYHNQQLNLLSEMVDRKSKGLPLKRHQIIASDTTPEKEVVEKMRRMLDGGTRELKIH